MDFSLILGIALNDKEYTPLSQIALAEALQENFNPQGVDDLLISRLLHKGLIISNPSGYSITQLGRKALHI